VGQCKVYIASRLFNASHTEYTDLPHPPSPPPFLSPHTVQTNLNFVPLKCLSKHSAPITILINLTEDKYMYLIYQYT
jgi:hypothetical protein